MSLPNYKIPKLTRESSPPPLISLSLTPTNIPEITSKNTHPFIYFPDIFPRTIVELLGIILQKPRETAIPSPSKDPAYNNTHILVYIFDSTFIFYICYYDNVQQKISFLRFTKLSQVFNSNCLDGSSLNHIKHFPRPTRSLNFIELARIFEKFWQ